jgi:predicted DNA-binding protein
MSILPISSAVPGSNGAQGRILHDEFLVQLGQLAEKWQSHHRVGLELRHQTGKLLNNRFGDPNNHQKHGEQVLKEASERLHIAQSELSRMRRFAHHFQSFEDFQKGNPGVTLWSEVKELLPKLKQKGQSPDSAVNSPKRTKEPSKLKGMKQSLANFSTHLQQVKSDLTKEEREDLLEAFQDLVKAVSDCLKVQVSVSQVSAEPSPPAGPIQ